MRLFRHLSFSNVIAVIALFVALGGAAYAGSKINGKNIVNASIGGGKLKNETITAKQIKKGTITGAQIQEGSISSNTIDLSTLGTVPSANTANSATKATSATTAGSAENAAHANDASHATEAEKATHASEADEAKTLEGETAAQLTVSCQSGTSFYGGMCWDEATRPLAPWITAIEECAGDGGRLPTISELIAFVLRPGEQVSAQVWSGDLADVVGPAEDVLTSDEHGRNKREGAGFELGYRCVFPLSN
jgi:hypothetical protein